MQVDIFYEGEFIATGETTFSPWMLWTFIKPSPEVNTDLLVAKLEDIRDERAMNFEVYVDHSVFGFPPAFTVKKSEALV